MPMLPGQAPGLRKPGQHRASQPKGKSLAALALAADTLVEAGQIGVRMPGDPPRCEHNYQLFCPVWAEWACRLLLVACAQA